MIIIKLLYKKLKANSPSTVLFLTGLCLSLSILTLLSRHCPVSSHIALILYLIFFISWKFFIRKDHDTALLDLLGANHYQQAFFITGVLGLLTTLAFIIILLAHAVLYIWLPFSFSYWTRLFLMIITAGVTWFSSFLIIAGFWHKKPVYLCNKLYTGLSSLR
ncbi:hypothetical protein CI610_02344 [invertebrate metagenome]|uniref:Uncharacterized protein n=1 Tax=invertebrate metagenome TaxID=1711999 RepID=A0A2H9T680_9ZZZZ